MESPDTVRYFYGINEFEWHRTKADTNREKHGVNFEEAATIFEDDFAIVERDEDHSEDEIRFLMLGLSDQLNLLSVVHLERGPRLRIISARLADTEERKLYDRERRTRV